VGQLDRFAWWVEQQRRLGGCVQVMVEDPVQGRGLLLAVVVMAGLFGGGGA
jgi:hypothetical protein